MAAALVRRAWSWRFLNVSRLAASMSMVSAPGSASTASATAPACSGDREPCFMAVWVLGWPLTRWPVRRSRAAAPTDVPVWRDSQSSAERSPWPTQAEVSATRVAASVRAEAAIFSISENSRTSTAASAPAMISRSMAPTNSVSCPRICAARNAMPTR